MSSEKMHYFSKGETVDGTSYCSAVETLAENIIEDNEQDAVLVFPSINSWITPRASAYRATSENAEIHLPMPIYKITAIKLLVPDFTITYDLQSYKYNEFKNSKGESPPNQFDVTKFILNKKEWAALPLSSSTSDYLGGVYKDNTFYWEEGTDKIALSGKNNKLGVLFFSDDTPVYSRLLRSAIYQMENVKDYKTTAMGMGGATYDLYLDKVVGITSSLDSIGLGIMSFKFRVEYVPMTSKTKMRARKNAQTKVDYIQPFNQRAEINAASAFGKNMWLTAQKTGCREIKLVKNYTKLGDIPPLGALVMHNGKRYRLVANHYVQTNTVFMQVTHTLSENWSKKSEHVSVDQKYRNWNIPQETLWRNLYWEDYLRVGTSLKKGADVNGSVSLANIMQGLVVSSTNDTTIDNLEWSFSYKEGGKEYDDIVVAPCSTYGIAHSLIFSASFKDNLSAGLRVADTDKYLCEETFYCKSDGTLDTATVKLGEGFVSVNPWLYPRVSDADNKVDNVVFEETFQIDKDPGEALKFTYQIHLIGEDNCLFGNKFAEHNPLIKEWNENRKFKVWLLTRYIREGADILETGSGDTSYDHTTDGEQFTLTALGKTAEYGEAYQLSLKNTVINNLANGSYRSWAITDENGNLYVGANDANINVVYLQLHHKR